MVVPRCGRTGEVVEPMLTDQWYVAMRTPAPASHPLWPGKTIQQLCLDAVSEAGIVDPQTGEAGRVRFVPGEWISTYRHWIDNIQDWCISRQLWWGHQIPAWYDDAGNVYVARTEADARAQATRRLGRAPASFVRDEDVLDTWFSSALWCHSTLGWPADTRELRTFLPSSVLVTGFDIIFFWVARMIMTTTCSPARCRSATSTSTPSSAMPKGRRCRSRRAMSSIRSISSTASTSIRSSPRASPT